MKKMSSWKSSYHSEAVVQRCSARKLFLEISQNSQENPSARVSFLIKLQALLAALLKKRLWHLRFSDFFRGYRKGTLAWNGLIQKWSFRTYRNCFTVSAYCCVISWLNWCCWRTVYKFSYIESKLHGT